ncbi:MAG TPA: hypothetical protein P5211_05505, partial [Anaerolineae bacterium]|nr:hypothetical protein [Anaerolineae bacterium]
MPQEQQAMQAIPKWTSEGAWWDGGRSTEIGALFDPRRLETPMDRQERRSGGRRSRTVTTLKRGRYVRARPSPRDPSDLALDATLRAAAPFQSERHATMPQGPVLQVRSHDYQRKVRVRRAANL